LHPAYSSDGALLNYYLFFDVVQFERTTLSKYSQNREIKEFFSIKEIAFYQYGIQLLPERWQKIVESYGNYFN